MAVNNWLGDSPLEIVSLDLDRNPVVIELSGPAQPPPEELLEIELATVLQQDIQVAVFVDETKQATTTTTAPITDEQIPLERTQDVVAAWLSENDDGNNYQLNVFSLEGSDLILTVSGLSDRPPILDLIDRLGAADPSDIITPTVQWSQLEEVPIGEEAPTPLEVTRSQLVVIVDSWAFRNGLTVTGLSFDGSTLIIDVEGAAPAPIEPLLLTIAASDVDGAESIVTEVFFTRRIRLETTTTTLPAALLPDFGDLATTTTTEP